MATQEFLTKRDQAFDLLFEVIKLAKEPENNDKLDGLKQWLLADAGKQLVIALNEAEIKSSNGTIYPVISPLDAYEEKCKEQAAP